MKATSIMRFASIILAAVLLVGLSSCSKPRKTFASINDRMQHEAQVAAEAIQKDTGLNVSYSMVSIKLVEQTLGRLAESVGKTDPQAANTHAVTFGAYVGECLRKKHGGEWAEENAEGTTTYKLKLASGTVLAPVTWCFQRITGTEKENVYKKVLAEVKAAGVESGGKE